MLQLFNNFVYDHTNIFVKGKKKEKDKGMHGLL